MRIVPIPCLSDNYAYLVICESTMKAAVVDPSAADPVAAAIAANGVTLAAIWNTHHHWDHTGGNKALLAANPSLEVVAHQSDRERVPGQTVFANDGDQVSIGNEVGARIIFNPGHTTGAISFHLEREAVVFTGDTLFGAGCGRMFEGTASGMHDSLMRLAGLPDGTQVYCGHEYTQNNLRFAAAVDCGHEYTQNNLRFAAAVEPDNQAVADRRGSVDAARARDEQTIPFLIDLERETNPFLRAAVPRVAAAAQVRVPTAKSEAEIFAALRSWKDGF